MTAQRIQLMQAFEKHGYEVSVARNVYGVEVRAKLLGVCGDRETIVRNTDGRSDADEATALATMAELLGMKTPAETGRVRRGDVMSGG